MASLARGVEGRTAGRRARRPRAGRRREQGESSCTRSAGRRSPRRTPRVPTACERRVRVHRLRNRPRGGGGRGDLGARPDGRVRTGDRARNRDARDSRRHVHRGRAAPSERSARLRRHRDDRAHAGQRGRAGRDVDAVVDRREPRHVADDRPTVRKFAALPIGWPARHPGRVPAGHRRGHARVAERRAGAPRRAERGTGRCHLVQRPGRDRLELTWLANLSQPLALGGIPGTTPDSELVVRQWVGTVHVVIYESE